MSDFLFVAVGSVFLGLLFGPVVGVLGAIPLFMMCIPLFPRRLPPGGTGSTGGGQ